jgi:hypothetical protein
MKPSKWNRCAWIELALSLCIAANLAPVAQAIPSFQSIDWRLPNPDRPYEMVSGTVHYDVPQHFSIYDLEFAPSDPSQLDFPERNPDGSSEFDSTFDITYRAVIGISTQPPRTVTGTGKARAIGFAPAEIQDTGDFRWSNVQAFDTELVALDLSALSPIPEIMLRESPSIRSNGVILREDQCPVCMSPFAYLRISSFFDIATEVTFDGGVSWTPASDFIHVEQAPDGFPPGDYNHDHAVDSADYIVWRKTLGEVGAGLAADGDWSGRVDKGDLEVLRTHLGTSTGGGAGNGAIPEPANGVLVGLGAMAAIAHRMGYRRRNPSERKLGA